VAPVYEQNSAQLAIGCDALAVANPEGTSGFGG